MKRIGNTTARFVSFVIILLIALSQGFVFASENEVGSAIIKGKVVTNNGTSVIYATVTIKENNRTVLTDEEGFFTFRNINAGQYSLMVSSTGFGNATKIVEVQDQTTSTIVITIETGITELAEVTVNSGRRKFYRVSSETVARMPLKNLENPQVYNTITSSLLQEQVITQFDDALKNAPGIDKLWTSTGRGGDGAAYFSLRGFSVQPSMINGVAGLTNGGLDPANIESIEVIKGPSGTLFGSSLVSFGGLINLQTKRPYDTTGGEISYTGGGFGLNRLTADINTPLNASKKALFRLNTAYHSEGSFQDAGFRKSLFVAPSFAFKANERLSFLLNTEFYQSEATNPLMLFLNRTRKLNATNVNELKVDFNRSFTGNDITIKTPTVNLFGQMTYKLSNNWTSQTNISRSTRKSDGYYSYVMYILPGDSLLNRYISNQNATGYTSSFQQNFIGDFTIGKMRNRMVAGIDVLHLSAQNNSSAYILFDTVNAIRTDNRYTQLTKAALDARFVQNNNPTRNTTNSYTYSAYVSNVLNITDQLMTMLSVRVDRFDNKGTLTHRTNTTAGAFAQTAVSPKLGLVYQVVKDKLSLFGNYMNGFRNVNAITQPDGTVSNFKPQQANQWEGGVKAELLNRKITASLSYYQIYVTNITRPDPSRAGFTIQDGNMSSKGFEADISANPLPGLNLIAGYSLNRSLNDQTDPASNGRRPVTAGPEQLVNFWTSYQFVHGRMKGWGMGIGGNYASENLITNNSVNGVFTLPAYTVLNSTLFYNTSAFRIALKVDNLFNERYFKGWTTVEPQLPRRLSANISFRF